MEDWKIVCAIGMKTYSIGGTAGITVGPGTLSVTVVSGGVAQSSQATLDFKPPKNV